MPKAGFYAVRTGRRTGVYSTWQECEGLVKGFPNARYKKFNTLREAEQYIGVLPIVTSATASHFDTPEEPNLPLPSVAASTSTSRPSNKPYDRPKVPAKDKGKQKEVISPSPVKTDITVYTDGACSGNGKQGAVAGIGVWYGHNDSRNLSERCPGPAKNNRAEIIAIIRCLEEEREPTKGLTIKTDSQYSISCIRDWMPRWKANGWKRSSGGKVQNKEIIEHLANLLDSRPGPVHFVHVKGHAGEEGNEGADRLAVAGARLPPVNDRTWHTKDLGTTNPRKDLVVEADFPMLSNDEMDRMEREQDFD